VIHSLVEVKERSHERAAQNPFVGKTTRPSDSDLEGPWSGEAPVGSTVRSSRQARRHDSGVEGYAAKSGRSLRLMRQEDMWLARRGMLQ
jgi:hypothetical protein